VAHIPKKNEHLKRSRLQERRGASKIGGNTTPGSGNQWHSKNDVKTPDESVELKTTTKDSYRLMPEEIHKVVTNALLDGNRLGWLEIEFANRGTTVVVLDADDFYALRHELHELREKCSP
jgi:hypothetical protein